MTPTLSRAVRIAPLTFVLTALAAVVLPAHRAVAQGGGSVRGTITSAETRAPIAGARVAVAAPARVAITGGDGRYLLRDLPPGDYEVTVTAIGRAPERRSVTLAASGTATLDIALTRGSLMLSSIIVSATRAPTEANRVAATVNVLTPEQIRTSPARETQDLLREIPGVELPRTSSQVGGSAQIVSIRGVDEGRTVVLFDGIPVNDAWGEWIDWSRVPKGMLDRVEVVEGGTSNLYGNGAMGGVISFFSRPVSPGSYDVQLDGGSRNARHAFASIGVPLGGPFAATVTGDYGDGGGYTMVRPDQVGPIDEPSSSVRRNALARVEYAPSSRLNAFVTGHLFSDDRDLGTPLARTARRNGVVDLGLNYGAIESGLVTLRAWDSEMREDQYTSVVAADRASERQSAWLHIPSHDWGAAAQWTRSDVLGLESLSFGADFRHMNGFTGEYDYAANGTTTYLFSGGDQVLSGAFAQGVWAPLSPVRVELGARVDHWGNDNGVATDASGTTRYENRGRDAFSPRLGVRYQVARPLALHGAAYQAFRAPNLAELYRKFVSGPNTNLPNPALRPEYATGYEAGFDWQPAGWMQLKGTAYTADMRDLNTFVTIAPGQRQRQNVQKSRSRGGEAYLALRPTEPLLFTASASYDNARLVAGPAGTKVGARVARVPMQKEVVRASYNSPRVGAFTVMLRHEGETTTFQGVPLEPFTVVDADIRRAIVPGLSAFLSVENVANTEYQVNLSGGLVTLGLPRTVRIGMEAARF